jgi:predicted HicB family RNase H-like nuclease
MKTSAGTRGTGGDDAPGDAAFHGIGPRDMIPCTGKSLDELQTNLVAGVEDSLGACAEDGVSPKKNLVGQDRASPWGRLAPPLSRIDAALAL